MSKREMHAKVIRSLYAERKRTWEPYYSPIEAVYDREVRHDSDGIEFQRCGGGRRIIRKRIGNS